MKLGACCLLLLAVLGPCAAAAALVLQSGEELEAVQEDAGTREIGFGQALGHRINNKIHITNAANEATLKKYVKGWKQKFSKHFGGKRSIDTFPQKKSPSTQSQYSQKWTNQFGKLFGGQKLTEGDYPLGGSSWRQQRDTRRPNSRLLQQWNAAYERYFGKKKHKYHKDWSDKYNKLFG